MKTLEDKDYIFILGSRGNKKRRIKQLEEFDINTDGIKNHEGYTFLNPIKKTIIKSTLNEYYESRMLNQIEYNTLFKFYNNSNMFRLW